ncbi:hypothetical protein C900_00329 [Fulvivirga imtechensis AK7]|uniref:Uncharacterized protein n=1 Tax=Fulvivirga imtechensis AK7 TaxID=1237149 RepID=L8JI45_9BACT|nr:hypothetical protein C900_00329 [Fulvivirga imtechensis AK7]
MNQRASMKDNPYSSVNKSERIGTSNYDELIAWKRRKLHRAKRRASVILLILISVVLLMSFLLNFLI